MIQLYTAATGNGRRATIMLEECGLAYTAHKIELGKNARKPAEFLKINPQGTIPVIVDPDGSGGKPATLSQSGAIVLYLAEKTGKFLPRDAAARMLAHQWFIFAVTDAGPASGTIFQASTAAPEKVPSVVSFFEDRFLGFCRVCDERLGKAEYLAGALTIADLALYPVIAGRQALLDKAEGLAHLKRWAGEMARRPAIERAMKVAA